MGTRGTMIVEAEQNVLLYTERDPNKKGARAAEGGDRDGDDDRRPASRSSKPARPGAARRPRPAKAGTTARPSAAATARRWRTSPTASSCGARAMDKDRRLPRCHGEVAMADAIIALTSNLAMKKRQRIEFDEKWFDPASRTCRTRS